MNLGHFYGKVVDATTEKPIDAASVQLIQTKLDSATKKRKDVVVAGMLTNKKGEFSLENLPILATFKLVITAIGYKNIEEKVAFDVNFNSAKAGDYTSMINGVDKDLGNFKLQADVQQLQDVTVTANKPLMTMSIDRKIYNVEKDITATGGTAQDVMKNVPGVNVDIDGNVTMRNASPQIFVDGRPTTLTLDQIPADEISTVELITNPSAKYDASGGGAGILNIVLKKNKKAGYNGNIRASIDSRARPNVGGNINIKGGKVNFFLSGALGFRKSVTDAKSSRTDYSDTAGVSHFNQNDHPVNDGNFAFLRTGLDYFIDNRNTITIGGNVARGKFTTTDVINIARDTDFINRPIFSDIGIRNSDLTSEFRNYGGTLSFKHNFAKANKDITADLSYNYSKSNNNNLFNTLYSLPDNTPEGLTLYQQTSGGGHTGYFTAQTDYENPITDKIKIEAGARVAFRNFNSFTNNLFKDPSDDIYKLAPLLSNNYKFNDQVLAAYVTFSQQIKNFTYQLGLRAESSKYDGTLNDTASFSNKFPLDLFPSAYLTYKLNDKQSLQLNYSRKINRPNFFQLIPFVDYTDTLNLSKGNPNLVPEYTNSLELSYQDQINNGNMFLATAYFRNTNNLISRYQYKDKDPNPLRSDSVILTSYANAQSSYTYGLELTSKNKLTDFWNITTNVNFFNGTINADNLQGGSNNSQFSWFGKLSNEFKLPKNFSIQLTATYNSKTLIPPSSGGSRGGPFFGGQTQPTANGYIAANSEVEFAIKKDFLKNNAASLTLQMSDIFRTKIYESISQSSYFTQDNWRLRDPQVLRLTFNWRFGKLDASLFKRKNLKSEQENIQNGMQGVN
ncbi:TonB-dependent receptor family protein [Ferruginibacter albus]|nr:TonB-dependent receptor family protein [Ferruginibacter albus]